MRVSVLRTAVALAVLAGWNPPLVSSPAAGKTTNPTKQWRSGSAGPFGDRLVFERNAGQAPPEVTHIARGPGYRLLLGRRSAVFLLGRSSGPPSVVRLELAGARDPSAVEGVGRLPSRSHYFLNGRTTALAAPHFTGVRYRRVYPGIDLVFYGRRRDVEFDLVVSPGADPGRIGWRYYGARRVALDGEALLVETPAGSLRQHAPVAIQEVDGERRRVECRYVLEDGLVRLALGPYRRDLPLVIDPVVTYATYVGGAGADYVTAMAVDSAGYLYLTGYTRSASLPGLNGYQQFNAGLDDVFVAKLSPDGTSLVWVSFLGGAAWDYGRAIAVDAAGNVYLAGESWSSDYPLTLDSYRPFCCGVFVTKLDPAGAALIYSTFLGSGYAKALAVDDAGAVYVGGWTTSAFPTTTGAYQETLRGMEDGFVAKVSPDGAALVYATYVGGGANDRIVDLALDSSGSVHVAGFTESVDFPVTANAAQAAFGGLRDAFVVTFSAALDALQYAGYLGGSGLDYAASIAVDGVGRAYVAGATESTDFPTAPGSYQVFPSGSAPWGFVSALDPLSGALVYSTYFGQRIDNGGIHIAVDGAGSVFLAGTTTADGFPTTPDAFQGSPAGGRDGFLAQLGASGAEVLFSSRLGGSQDDYVHQIGLGPPGSVFITGITRSADFPVTPDAAQTSFAGAADAFVMRVDFDYTAPAEIVVPASDSTLPGSTVTFQWSAGVGPTAYVLYLGSQRGYPDLYQSPRLTGTLVTVSMLPTDGRTVYARLWSLIEGNWIFRDFTFRAASTNSGPFPAEIISPALGSALPGSTVTFQWTSGFGATDYVLYLGSVRGYSDLYQSTRTQATSTTVTMLPIDGRTVYARLWSFIGGTWYHRDYIYSAATSGSGPLPAEITDPPLGTVLGGSTVTFQWSSGLGAAGYVLYVGSARGHADLYLRPNSPTTSATVTMLPTDGRKVYVRLWSLINGNWYFRDYVYWAASGGGGFFPAEIVSPGLGAQLPGSVVTFQWTTGVGPTQYLLYVGTKRGNADLFQSSPTSETAITVGGLPTDGSLLYVRLWSLIGDTWYYRDYTYPAATSG